MLFLIYQLFQIDELFLYLQWGISFVSVLISTHRVHSTCVGQERGSKLQDKYNKRNPQKSPLGGKMAPDNHFS